MAHHSLLQSCQRVRQLLSYLVKDPATGEIPRSEISAGIAEQSGEGPGNGKIPRSATGKQGIKRKLEQKTLEETYEAILEVEKGQV